MKKKTIIFIVGTSRSGTTLLQHKIASNFKVSTSEETHFFRQYYRFPFLGRLLSINSLRKSLKILCPNFCIDKFRVTSDLFGDAVSQRLIDDSNTTFVEKTPIHLWYINKIKNDLQDRFDLFFIHIFRQRYENVRSLYMATLKNPGPWGGKRSVKNCVDRWNYDMDIHLQNVGKKNHYFINYESITTETGISKFLSSISSIPNLKPRKGDDFFDVKNIISNGERWKSNNLLKLGSNSKHDGFMHYKDFMLNYGDQKKYEELKNKLRAS